MVPINFIGMGLYDRFTTVQADEINFDKIRYFTKNLCGRVQLIMPTVK